MYSSPHIKSAYFLFIVFTFALNSTVAARSVILNGVDVSNARQQSLKQVDIEIDENGDVLITAPHYRVLEDKSYQPLSSALKSRAPTHAPVAHPIKTTSLGKPGEQIPSAIDDPASALPNENPTASSAFIEKPGTKNTTK